MKCVLTMLLSASLPVAATTAENPPRMPEAPSEFLRFTAPDQQALRRDIEAMRARLAEAEARLDDAAIVDHAADLGGMLTTAREEAAAWAILGKYEHLAERLPHKEQAAWYWNALATALQYQGRRDQADRYFVKAVDIARDGGWKQIEAMTLHHWGRSLAERRMLDEAASCFERAAVIREQIGDPRHESSRRALAELARLRASR